MRVGPARKIRGRLSLPGDKSISHRAAIIGTLATGSCRLNNFATSADCMSTVSCLRQLGAEIRQENSAIKLHGMGGGSFLSPSDLLDCGNSGSSMRMLCGVLAAQKITAALTGDSSLLSRPMKRVIDPLTKMGADIQSQDGRPPLIVKGSGSLIGIDYSLPIPSAQVKSALLLAGINAHGPTTVTEVRSSTRDHTERMLNWFEVPVENRLLDDEYTSITVTGQDKPVAKDVDIPGDVSSAAYFVAAAALLPGSELEVVDVGLNPTRIAFLLVLQKLGLDLTFDKSVERSNEPVGTILVRGSDSAVNARGGMVIEGLWISQLIDELPLLAVVATQIEGGLIFRGAQELRFKESDRISATVENLRRMGIQVEEFPDGLGIGGPQRLKGARLDSFGDHRIAMAFSVAALLAKGDSEISNTDCVSISFPEFFQKLGELVQR